MSASESGSETETSMEEKPESETEQGSEEEEEEEDDHDANDEQPKGTMQSEEEDDGDEETAEEEEEEEDGPEKQEDRPARLKPAVQSMPKPGPAVQKKPAMGPTAQAAQAASANKSNHPSYMKMVLDAMQDLVTDERRNSGVTFAKINKFVAAKTEQTEAHVKLWCWKAIEKHIKDEILMKKTGIGMNGSVGYSAKYREKLKKAANPKPPKAAKPKAKPAPKKKPEKAAPAAKADPKKKPAAKAKPAKKDSNNNSKTAKPAKKVAAGTKKAVVSKTTGKVRLSVGGPMVAKPKKPVAKAKPAAGAKKEAATKKPAAGVKTKAPAPAPEVAGPSKKAKKLKF